MQKIKVGILGATGAVGQRFIELLENHPWFEVAAVAASPRSAGRKYSEAVEGRWFSKKEIPANAKDLIVSDVANIEGIKNKVDFVFSAIEASKDEIKAFEDKYAENDIPVVSNNSAHRWTKDVPMIMPEINPHHLDMIKIQQKNHGWKK
ncbi:aspartate-semialdehyde dehydrogenase, partial [Candidatus Woesearchaeota archaeon]|nr:aspartate-semialdehyde dehydrogenase [Candidatus Woesearchaeota archaeon]